MKDEIFFVTRLKSNADAAYLLKRAGRKAKGITNDQQISLKDIDEPLRLIAYTDQETGQQNCGYLQRTLADRAVLQMDQTTLEDQNISWNFEECRTDPNLDCPLCLSTCCLSQISIQTGQVNVSNSSGIADEPI
jgi:hypothetical protein